MKFISAILSSIFQWKVPAEKFSSIKEEVSSGPLFFIFLILLTAVTILRIICSVNLPISGDEAYYYLWSKYPSPGYYDHPPMISWIVAFFSYLGGDNLMMVRIGSIIAAFIYSLILFFLARELTNSNKIAFMSGIILLIIPYFAIDSTMTTPNVPLLLFWTLYMFLLNRALMGNSLLYWILSGVALGLALLSKFMALFLIVSIVLFLLLSARYRYNLKRAGPYLSFFVALVVFSPFLIWNHYNNWESFSFQLVERHHFPLQMNFQLFGEFLGMQALAVTPLFFILFIVSLGYAFFKGTVRRCNNYLFCCCISAPIFILFVTVSFFERVEMYWPITGYLSGSICVAMMLEEWLEVKARLAKAALKVLYALTFIMLIFSTGALYFYALNPASLLAMCARTSPVGEEKFEGNSLIEMYAYSDLADYLVRLQADIGGKDKAFIMTDNYSMSSALTYYAEEYIHIYSPWNLQGREYQKWEDYSSLKGIDAIYVDRFPIRERENMLKLFSQNFDEIKLFEPLVMKKHGEVAQVFYIALCKNFHGTINYNNSLDYEGTRDYEKLELINAVQNNSNKSNAR